MAKEKQTRRMIAMALAAAVAMSSMPMVAFADEVPAGESTTVSESASTPANEAPAPANETPAPANEAPAPVNEAPAPVNETPAPANEAPADTLTIEISTVPDEETHETVYTEDVEVKGDADKSDGKWNYTETTTTETLTVDAQAGAIESQTGEIDMDYVSSDTDPDGTNDLVDISKKGSEAQEIEPGDQPGYTLIGTENTSKFFPAIHFGTTPLEDAAKEELFGDGAFIYNDGNAKHYLSWLEDREYADSIPKKEDGTYYTDEEGFILDAEGKRIHKEEKYVVGPDGKTKYYLHRFDAMGNNLKVEGWYQDGEWIKDFNGNDIYQVVYATPQQFTLVDNKTGEKITAYCADQATPTENGYYYDMVNIEDADYYTDDQAAMIRAIAQAGYWGAKYEKDKNGNVVYEQVYQPVINEETGEPVIDEETGEPVMEPVYKEVIDEETGEPVIDEETGLPKMEPVMVEKAAEKGTLDAVKAQLKAAGWTEEDIASVTDGVALTATQMAIWSQSNKMDGLEYVNAHYTTGGVEATELTFNKYMAEVIKNGKVPVEKEDEVKALFKLYEYFMALDPITFDDAEKEVEPTTADTIINAKNFLDGDMEITVLEKVKDHENNKDNDDTNDAYTTKLTFAFVVDAKEGNDDNLVVHIFDGDQLVGTGRYAGELQPGETQLVPDEETGKCSMEIVTVEGQTQKLNVAFSGWQNLQDGAYLLQSEVRNDVESQTLVTMAGGKREVNVSQTIEFNFQVDEDKVVVRERSSNGNRDYTPKEDNPQPNSEDPVIIDEGDVPLVELPDVEEEEGMVLGAEDVVDAEEEPMVLGEEEELIAATGDSNHMAAGFGGMLAALAGMLMLRKKKEN